jgi:agmatine deiminase
MASPAERGFRLPPETREHEATWLAWPVATETWVAGLDPAREAYLAMVEAIHPGERVDLLAPPDRAEAVLDRLRRAGLPADPAPEDAPPTATSGVRVHAVDYADGWLRDTGPTVLVDGEGDRLAVDWRFDAWGGRYPELERDDVVAARLAELAGLETVRVDEVLEGGAVVVDADGRCLASATCLTNPNRGDRSREHVRDLLERVLGVEEVVWLEGALAGDDTDGHVDTMARFAGPGTVLAARTRDRDHPDHDVLEANLERLEDHPSLSVRTLPHPSPATYEGRPVPRTYANHYVANGAVLVPTYGDPADEAALAALEAAYGRPAVGIDARALVVGCGAVHCLTCTLPAP